MIALVDTKKHTRKNKSTFENYYSLPLLKIASFLKRRGLKFKIYNSYQDLLNSKKDFSEILITTLFTYDMKEVLTAIKFLKNRTNKIRIGGISATLMPEIFEAVEDVIVHKGLLTEVENVQIDYSILNFEPRSVIIYTSRGCPRKCEFCGVKDIEPYYFDIPNWEKNVPDFARKIVFWDNNFLARELDSLWSDIKKIRDMENIISVDFRQALDFRLFKGQRIDMIKHISDKIKPVRFALDSNKNIDDFFWTAKLANKYINNTDQEHFMLWNYKDTPEDIWHRLRIIAELNDVCKKSVYVIPSCYEPINFTVKSKKNIDIFGRDNYESLKDAKHYISPNWSKELIKGLKNIFAKTGFGKNKYTLKEFYGYFGDNANNFIDIISDEKCLQKTIEKRNVFRKQKNMRG